MVLRHTEVHQSRIPADPAGSVSARYSRDPTGDGLPVLSQLRRSGCAVERAEHRDLHELPHARQKTIPSCSPSRRVGRAVSPSNGCGSIARSITFITTTLRT